MKIFQKISVADHEKAMDKLTKRLESQFKLEVERRLNDRDDVWRIEIEKLRNTPVSERNEMKIDQNIQSMIGYSSQKSFY